MKNLKKVLALVLAVVMIMGTVAVASAKDYADIKADSDYAEAIDVLSNLNILDGFKTGETYNFQPDGYFLFQMPHPFIGCGAVPHEV